MRIRTLIVSLLALPAASAGAHSQDEPPDINFQFKVDQAIDKGVAFLKGKRTGSSTRTPSTATSSSS